MAIETAADLAVFFNPEEFGQAATYTPLVGPPIAVTVVPFQADGEVAVFQSAGSTPTTTLLIRASEVGAPATGDEIVLGSEPAVTYVVQLATRSDDTRAVWTLDTYVK